MSLTVRSDILATASVIMFWFAESFHISIVNAPHAQFVLPFTCSPLAKESWSV